MGTLKTGNVHQLSPTLRIVYIGWTPAGLGPYYTVERRDFAPTSERAGTPWQPTMVVDLETAQTIRNLTTEVTV